MKTNTPLMILSNLSGSILNRCVRNALLTCAMTINEPESRSVISCVERPNTVSILGGRIVYALSFIRRGVDYIENQVRTLGAQPSCDCYELKLETNLVAIIESPLGAATVRHNAVGLNVVDASVSQPASVLTKARVTEHTHVRVH